MTLLSWAIFEFCSATTIECNGPYESRAKDLKKVSSDSSRVHRTKDRIDGKQVAVNFHQLYPQNHPQLPNKMVHYTTEV